MRIGATSIASIWITAGTLAANPTAGKAATALPDAPALTGKPWIDMDYGPTLTMSLEVEPGNIAYKGISVRLDHGAGGISAGRSFMTFDTDTLRMAAGWHGSGFIDWRSINFNGEHAKHPRLVGRAVFTNPVGPGWARPGTDNFDDPRLTGRDGKHYGPLDRGWARFKGIFRHGDDVVFSYTVGETEVLELPSREGDSFPLQTRTIELGPRQHDLVLQVAHATDAEIELRRRESAPGTIAVIHAAADEIAPREPREEEEQDDDDEQEEEQEPEAAGEERGGEHGPQRSEPVVASTCVGLLPGDQDCKWIATGDGHLRLKIPAGEATALKLAFGQVADPSEFTTALANVTPPADLNELCGGGPRIWNEEVTTEGTALGPNDGPYAVDVITVPHDNPYRSWMRLGGFDFFPGGTRAAVCTWQGDVWIVDGLDGEFSTFRWRRIASGMFQPLGLKIIDKAIYVTCRDQITILRDTNGDGETDFYENFNNDAQVTEHFHEFAVDLQVDDEGNLYYGKCARHAREALVPHHGTLLKVAADGSSTEIVASGFRAPNGVCVNPDGTFFMTDQEGHWTPKNRLNRVAEGGFYGNMMGYHDGRRPGDFDRPVCWIHNNYDRSPASQVWIDSDRWGPLQGGLLSTSYGTGMIHLALLEVVDGTSQGGLVRMPITDFPTGIMRGRFNPDDGQFYCCGLFGWSSNKTSPGGFYRVRSTGKSVNMPTALHATRDGIVLRFTDRLDAESASDWANYAISRWQYKRTRNYGSEDFKISNRRRQGRDPVRVEDVEISDDRRSVLLKILDMQPAMQMEIKYRIQAADGTPLAHTIHHTVHKVGNSVTLATAE